MNRGKGNKLVILVADKDMEFTIRGLLLKRSAALSVLPLKEGVDFKIFSHLNHDSGCYRKGVEFLRRYNTTYEHALIFFDYHGSGRDHSQTPERIEEHIEKRLSGSGWKDRARCIVLNPELEAWVWSDSSQVDEILGWSNRSPGLREWMMSSKLIGQKYEKPKDPKYAVKRAIHISGRQFSASLFLKLSESVDFERCQDRSFNKLKNTLREWFPA